MARRKKTEPAGAPEADTLPRDPNATFDGVTLAPQMCVWYFDEGRRRLVNAKVEGWGRNPLGHPLALLSSGLIIAPSLLYAGEATARRLETARVRVRMKTWQDAADEERRLLTALARKPRAARRSQRKEA